MATAEALSKVALMITEMHEKSVAAPSSSDGTPSGQNFETTAALADGIKSMTQKLKQMRVTENKHKAANKRIAKATNQVNELCKVRRLLANANPMAKKRMKERKRKLKKEIREVIKKVFPVVGETAEMKILKDSVGQEDEE